MNPAHAITGKKGAAFSLTEVVVALGVATVAIVSILALFPVGFDTVRESAAETQAAILARTIASDLVSGVRARGFSNAIVLKGNNNVSTNDYEPVNLAAATNLYVTYYYEGHAFIGDHYKPLALKAMGLTANSSNAVSGADFIAAITVAPVTNQTLAQVIVQISAPASVAFSNRTLQTTYSFLVGP